MNTFFGCHSTRGRSITKKPSRSGPPKGHILGNLWHCNWLRWTNGRNPSQFSWSNIYDGKNQPSFPHPWTPKEQIMAFKTEFIFVYTYTPLFSTPSAAKNTENIFGTIFTGPRWCNKRTRTQQTPVPMLFPGLPMWYTYLPTKRWPGTSNGRLRAELGRTELVLRGLQERGGSKAAGLESSNLAGDLMFTVISRACLNSYWGVIQEHDFMVILRHLPWKLCIVWIGNRW